MGRGHNHPLECSCGWCGTRQRKNYMAVKEIVPISKPKIFLVKLEIIDGKTENVVVLENNAIIKVTDLLSETKPTKCRFCGMEVYYYEKPTGSKVFFEHLGIPWTKHECKEYLEFKNNKK